MDNGCSPTSFTQAATIVSSKLVKGKFYPKMMTSLTLNSQPNEPAPANLLIRGANVSSLPRAGQLGARYYDEHGVQGDALQILQDHGLTSSA